MRIFNVSAAGAVAGVFLFGSVGSVSAIEPFDLSSVSLQYQREVRSTYIIQFQSGFDASEVEGRANAIAARYQGRIRHTYTRALSGFAIRMSSTAMARLLDADDLGIARVSRGVIMTVAQANGNAAPQGKGGNPGKPDKPGKGDGETEPTCVETLGWNISRVTPIGQNPIDDQDALKDCEITGAGEGGIAIDYSGSTLKVCVLDTGVSLHTDIHISDTDRYETSSTTTNPDDVYGHGTHVAGIIGAYANNNLGVVGVAPGVQIISIKVLGDDGSGSDFDAVAGIDTALGLSCDIVNMSLGGSKSDSLDTAIINGSSTTGNIIFTLAAGNSARDIEGYSPARTSTGPDDNIFTIASFEDGDANSNVWSSFSNYGVDTPDVVDSMVDFALPGGKILSTVPVDKYATLSGTSMSAPHMAGLLVRYIQRAMDKAATVYDCDDGRRCVVNGNFAAPSSVERTLRLGRRVIRSGEYYKIAVDP